MKSNYEDIRSRITEEPTWWDENGCPRYTTFAPDLCPNIYACWIVLLLIACQYCGQQFHVAMHGDVCMPLPKHPAKLHYGDPPAHGCVGDTMNCNDLEVLEVWEGDIMRAAQWRRLQKLEGVIDPTEEEDEKEIGEV